jgi:hypothetical protein
MISKIISRAACLTELTSNSKSVSNCPDLHGGVPGLPGDRICMKPAPKIRLSKRIANFEPKRLKIEKRGRTPGSESIRPPRWAG